MDSIAVKLAFVGAAGANRNHLVDARQAGLETHFGDRRATSF